MKLTPDVQWACEKDRFKDRQIQSKDRHRKTELDRVSEK